MSTTACYFCETPHSRDSVFCSDQCKEAYWEVRGKDKAPTSIEDIQQRCILRAKELRERQEKEAFSELNAPLIQGKETKK